jgi:hypothetical protein
MQIKGVINIMKNTKCNLFKCACKIIGIRNTDRQIARVVMFHECTPRLS